MAGQKLSAKATETVEYLEALLKETAHFGALVEQLRPPRRAPTCTPRSCRGSWAGCGRRR